MGSDVDVVSLSWSTGLLPAYNIDAMGLADYVTYAFASLVVALTITGELKDM